MNTTTPDSVSGPLPPNFPETHRTIDFSPLEFILGVVAVIAIPALIYTFFFAIKCPPNPFRGGRRRSSDSLPVMPGNTVSEPITKGVAFDVKHRKDDPVTGVESECPVCLSAFSDGEQVRQLTVCKHRFHGSCIDKWLNSRSNCPVCRAFVPVKRPSSSSSMARDPDLQQGLPDAASLV